MPGYRRLLIILIVSSLMWALVGFLITQHFNRPLVKIDSITGRCMEVVEGDYNCSNLPEKYRAQRWTEELRTEIIMESIEEAED